MPKGKGHPVQYESVVQHLRGGMSIADIFEQWKQTVSPLELSPEELKALAAESRAVLAFSWAEKDLRKACLTARRKRMPKEGEDA